MQHTHIQYVIKNKITKSPHTHKYLIFPLFTGILKQVIVKDFCPEAYKSLNNSVEIYRRVKYIPGVCTQIKMLTCILLQSLQPPKVNSI